jgi:hypothetical protein
VQLVSNIVLLSSTPFSKLHTVFFDKCAVENGVRPTVHFNILAAVGPSFTQQESAQFPTSKKTKTYVNISAFQFQTQVS